MRNFSEDYFKLLDNGLAIIGLMVAVNVKIGFEAIASLKQNVMANANLPHSIAKRSATVFCDQTKGSVQSTQWHTRP